MRRLPVARIFLFLFCCVCALQRLDAQPLEVTNAPPITPQNLITNVFLGEGVEVISVDYFGANKSVGFFKYGIDEVGIERGLVMTTGAAVTQGAFETGVNSTGNAFASVDNMSAFTDPDLQAIAGGLNIYNVTKYVITFKPIADTLRFRYVFGSEEYPEFACSAYNDIFGFFISGPGITGPYANNAANIALIPGTNLPVRINNVNSGVVGGAGNITNCTPPNGSLNYSQYYNDNNGSNVLPSYDGYTDVFTAEAIVVPCQEYTIKLVICDVSDAAFDSGVFLEAKSFGTGSLNVEATTVSLDGSIAEGCSPGTLTFSLPTPTESDLFIDYQIIGTAQNGVDYEFIPADLFIPAGDSILTVPIIAIEDGIAEAPETLVLDVQRDVCNRDTITIFIKDNQLVAPDLGLDQSVCAGTEIQLDGTLNVPVPEPPCFTNDNDLLITPTNVPRFSDITVGGVLPPILGPGVIRSVCIDSLSHRWIDDLDIYLISPDDQFIELTSDNGGNGGNGLAMDYYLHTCFTTDAALPINFPGPFAPPSAVPFTGNFLPEGVWSDLWDGNNKSTNGTWRLQLIDDTNSLEGTLHSWTICFNPAYEINYEWTPSTGLSCTDCPNPTVTPQLTATDYVLRAYDSYGCEVTDSIAISAIPILTPPNVSCGTATESTVAVFWDDIPGALGYEINIDNSGWGSPNNGLSHDVSGLVTSQSVTFQVRALGDCPGGITTITCDALPCTPAGLSASTTDASCNGGADGAVTITPTGGLAPFNYILGGQSNTTGSFANLPAGNYVATVGDASGCNAPIQFTIGEPAALALTAVTTPALCNGSADGSATLIVNGGAGPYAFSWSSMSVDSVATGLSAGNYDVTITDANGCPSISSVTIDQPTALQASTTPVDVSCFGLADGEATATATGGTGAYNYLWDAAAGTQNTATATGLAAGTFVVTVTDDNGCQATSTATINQNPTVQISASAVDATCNGAPDGQASVSASGGDGNFAYTWTRISDGTVVGNSANVLQLTAGDYSVDVVDGNGCSQATAVTIGQPQAINVSIAATSPLCNGSADGSATLTISGGSSPYNYQWSDSGAPTDTRNDLSAGNYLVTVTDDNSCLAIINIVLSDPIALQAALNTLPTSCNGGNNGQAAVQVTGGTGSYSYSWANGLMTPAVSGLSAGPVSITVTDANGCQTTVQGTVSQPTAISLTTSKQDPSCFGFGDGQATVTAGGGVGGYQYSWNSGQTTATAVNLFAGLTVVTVTDANGCQTTAGVTLGQPTALTATAADGLVSCNGASDGSVTVSPAGGTTPYSYLWNDPNQQNTATASGLILGTYSVTVTDANGCQATSSAIVDGTPAIVLALTTSDVNCNGGNDGTIVVNATGGAGSYTYSWSAPGIGSTATPVNLTAGNYSVTVSDTNGCVADASAFINQPSSLILSAGLTPALCAGEPSGAINLVVQGGTAPYTYLWTNGADTEDVTGLTSGNYRVTVTDANNCETTLANFIAEPPNLQTSFDITDITCFGEITGAVEATVVGGVPPYQLTWSNNQTGLELNPVPAGDYTLQITDANGCKLEQTATVAQPAEPVNAIVKPEDVICFGQNNGSIQITAAGGTPFYTYSLNGNQFSGSNIFIGLEPGNYNVYVRDARGCQFLSDAVVIAEPEELTISLGDNFNIKYGETFNFNPTITGSVGNIQYEWSPADTSILSCLDCGSPLVNITDQTSFEVHITDEKGCEAEDLVTVYVIKDNTAYVPTGFTPNGDGLNDRLLVHGKQDIKVVRFRIYDRWGEMVYEAIDFPVNDQASGWDGNFRDKPLNGGVFLWHLEVEYVDGTREVFRGETTLIR